MPVPPHSLHTLEPDVLLPEVPEEAFKNAKVTLVTLTNYEAVLDVALRSGYIEKEDIQTLNEWRKDPAHWDAGK